MPSKITLNVAGTRVEKPWYHYGLANRLPSIIEVVSRHDIISLCEVSENLVTTICDSLRLTHKYIYYLKYANLFYYVIGTQYESTIQSIPIGNNRYAIGLCYSVPVARSTTTSTDTTQRNILDITVHMPVNEQRQMSCCIELANWIQKHQSGYEIILTGDFNTLPLYTFDTKVAFMPLKHYPTGKTFCAYPFDLGLHTPEIAVIKENINNLNLNPYKKRIETARAVIQLYNGPITSTLDHVFTNISTAVVTCNYVEPTKSQFLRQSGSASPHYVSDHYPTVIKF